MQSLTSSISQKSSTDPHSLVLPKFPQITLRWILATGFCLISFLLISYIIQLNQLTKANFYISNYEQNIASVARENKDLEMNFSRTNSLAGLESLLKSLNYVGVNKIHYIQILQGEMAAK